MCKALQIIFWLSDTALNWFDFSFPLENVFQLLTGLDLSCQGKEISTLFCQESFCCDFFKIAFKQINMCAIHVISPKCNYWSCSLSFCGCVCVSQFISLSICLSVCPFLCPSISRRRRRRYFYLARVTLTVTKTNP